MPTKRQFIRQISSLSSLTHDEIEALNKSPKVAITAMNRLVEHFRDRTFGDAATILLHEGSYFVLRQDGSTNHPAIPQIISAHHIDERGDAEESYLLTTILDTPHSIPWIVDGQQHVVLIGEDGSRLEGRHELFVIRVRREGDWPVLDAPLEREVKPAPAAQLNQPPLQEVEMFALEGDPDAIAIGVEPWNEIEPHIERYIDEYGQERWYYIPGTEINSDGQYAIYTGWYDDGDPIGQAHNSYVRVYEMEEFDLWKQDVESVFEDVERGTEIV